MMPYLPHKKVNKQSLNLIIEVIMQVWLSDEFLEINMALLSMNYVTLNCRLTPVVLQTKFLRSLSQRCFETERRNWSSAAEGEY